MLSEALVSPPCGWRAAFAFDAKRNAVFLAAGDKSGRDAAKGRKRFYDDLVARADARFDAHVALLRK
jgi:hypothetical protein